MNNKGITITLIIVLSIIVVLLTAGFIFLLNNSFNFNFSFDYNDPNMILVDSKEYEKDSIHNIELSLKSTDVEIKQSENDIIKVELYSNNEKNPRIEIENNTLRIDEYKTEQVNVIFTNNNKKIVLYIPNEYLGEFNIEATSGDIVSNIDMTKNKANITTTSGDIALGKMGETNITATSGDIVIDNINKMINIRTTSGDIVINELNIEESSFIEATSGDIRINNNISDCYVDAKSISGDTKINKFDRKSEIELKIKTTSGDIFVN